MISEHNVTSTLLKELPEIQSICKADCNLSLSIDMPKQNATFVKILQDKGIVLGNNMTKATVDIMLQNSTVKTPTSILSFETTFTMDVNFTMQDVVFYPLYTSSMFSQTKLTNHSILMALHNYDEVFQAVAQAVGQSYNSVNKAGIPIAAIDPQLAMIGGLIKNSTISPYVSDGWLYAGFSMAADAPYYHSLTSSPNAE